MSRFAGIDLGTTNTSLAIADAAGDATAFAVPQLVARGVIEARAQLPSFMYMGHESDGALALPWAASQPFAVGEYARTRGLDAPARLVASAKSWLCHPSMDRRAAILPLNAPPDVDRVSPVEASYRYLEHLASAFDAAHAPARLSELPVVLTVPASFDAAARELTVEAAFAAGLENVTLLEEPQAAVYAWIAARGDAWRRELSPGDVVLVVDVGGGTTDFSAIAVTEREGALSLDRVAVGDHILLGGDNMDLLLAYLCKQKLEAQGRSVDAWQLTSLVFASRAAKERLLADATVASAPVAIAAKGASLVGGGLRTEITRDELEQSIAQGFFPLCGAGDRPIARPRGGLTQMGLPYAQDAAVTRHLAHFLARQGQPGAPLRPTAVLFNGGVMKSDGLRARVVAALAGWFGEAPRELPGADYDLAVAKGAAIYARSRATGGIRIRGGTARAFYVGIEAALPAVPGIEPPISALCVAPFGMEEGSRARVPSGEIGLVVGEKVRFRFFGSSVRRSDVVGASLERWYEGELEELSPIEATVPANAGAPGDFLPVTLASEVTAIGTLRVIATPSVGAKEPFALELAIREP